MATPSRAPCSAAICRRNACRGDRRAGQGGEGDAGGTATARAKRMLSAYKEDARELSTDAACPIRTGCGARRVQIVRGRAEPTWYLLAALPESTPPGIPSSRSSMSSPHPSSDSEPAPSLPSPPRVSAAAAPRFVRCVLCARQISPNGKIHPQRCQRSATTPPPRHGPLRARGQGPRRHGRGALGARGRHRPSSRSSLSMYCST